MHPLEQRIAALRRRVYLLQVLRGCARVFASALAAGVALVLVDYALGLEHLGLRLLLTLLWLTLVGFALYRWAWPAVTRPPSALRLTRHVERFFGLPADRLTSALVFLQQQRPDAAAGSAPLRRAVVHSAAADVEGLDLDRAVDPRPCWRAIAVAAGAVVVVGLLSLVSPEFARAGLVRLLNPLSSHHWPRKHHLIFDNPPVLLARGDTFEARLVDRGGRLPEQVTVYFRTDSASRPSELQLSTQGSEVVLRRENVETSFDFWAEGGDDHAMAPHRVVVRDAPAVKQLTVRLQPPEYTGWPTHESPPAIQALVGSAVEVRGRSTRALESAAVRLEDGTRIPLAITPGKHEFFLGLATSHPWMINTASSYWLELRDREGLTSRSDTRWAIQPVPDRPPGARIAYPAADVRVTSQARVPVHLVVNDDLAVARAHLEIAVEDEQAGAPERRELYVGPEYPSAVFEDLAASLGRDDRHELNETVDLATLPAAVPGARLTLVATAKDHRGAEGRSEPRKLIVVSEEELLAALGRELSELLLRLRQIHTEQRHSREQAEAAQALVRNGSDDFAAAADRMRLAETIQRKVSSALAEPSRGAMARARQLADELAMNRLQESLPGRQLREMLDLLEALERGPLPVAGQQATTVVKSLLSAAQDSGISADLFDALLQAQLEIERELERLLGDLEQSEVLRSLSSEAQRLAERQQELAEASGKLAAQTLGQDPRNLSPELRSEIARNAEQQRLLAQELERLEQQLQAAASQLSSQDAAAAACAGQALATAQQARAVDAMRRSAEDLEQNQIARANRQQAQAARDLKRIAQQLQGAGSKAEQPASGREEPSEQRDPKGGRQQEVAALRQRVERLRQGQAQLLDATVAAATQTGQTLAASMQSLAARQQQLQDAARALAKSQLELRVVQYGLERAGDAMAQAVVGLEAERAADAQQAQKRALSRLSDLAEALHQDAEERASGQGGNESSQQPPSEERQEEQQADDQRQPMILPELKLLRHWQEDLARRFRQVTREDGPRGQETDRDLEQLEEEQTRLAELMAELAQEPDIPVDVLDQLPEGDEQ